MAVKVLIIEDNPVARSFLCRVVRESFSDEMEIVEAGDLEGARRHVARLAQSGDEGGFKLVLVDLSCPMAMAWSFWPSLAAHRRSRS